MSLDRETLLAYRQRWQAVGEIENAERQRMTIEERWQKLNSLLRMAAALDLQPHNGKPQTDPTYQRWNQLRARYRAERQRETL